MAIALEARKPMAMDDFMTRYRKMGFARLRVEIDFIEPPKPGISIRSHNGVFWHLFVYENILAFYYPCEWLGHGTDAYQ